METSIRVLTFDSMASIPSNLILLLIQITVLDSSHRSAISLKL